MGKRLFTVFLVLLISLLLLEVVLRILTKEKTPGYEYFLGKPWRYLLPFSPEFISSDTSKTGKYKVYDAHLGWDIGIHGAEEPLYYSNTCGLRCSKLDYLSSNCDKRDTFDIICIGNSFTHGDAVSFEENWTYQLEKLTGKSVLNLGVGGYGIDQSALKLENRLAQGYYADTVLLGLIAGDLDRSLYTIYNLYNGGTKTKPKFLFNTDSYCIINQPCAVNEALQKEYQNFAQSELFRNNPGFSEIIFKKTALDKSYFYRILKSTVHQKINRHIPVYLSDDERLEYCMKILDYLKNTCERNGQKLIILLLGNNNSFNDRAFGENPWILIENKLSARGFEFLNADKFQYPLYKSNRNQIIHAQEGVHYSPEGNYALAKFLKDTLF